MNRRTITLSALATAALAGLTAVVLTMRAHPDEGSGEVERLLARQPVLPPPPPPPDPLAVVQLMEAFPPVREVRSIPVAAVAEVADAETVLGLEVGGEARAYPLNGMCEPRQEVLNDVLGGRSVVVTYCSRCRDGRVFDRTVSGRVLTFYLPGAVMGGSMLVSDLETQSTWSQIVGDAEFGPLKGTELAAVPSVVTDWATWKRLHPATTLAVLPRQGANYDDHRAVVDRAVDASVIGLSLGKAAQAWPLRRVRDHGPILDTFDGRPVVVAFDPAGASAGVFRRDGNDGKVLEFTSEGGKILDAATRSEWDLLDGKAIAGPLAGRRLERLPAFVIQRTAWMKFHPIDSVRNSGAEGESPHP